MLRQGIYSIDLGGGGGGVKLKHGNKIPRGSYSKGLHNISNVPGYKLCTLCENCVSMSCNCVIRPTG